jgi:steroid delta-isomerase
MLTSPIENRPSLTASAARALLDGAAAHAAYLDKPFTITVLDAAANVAAMLRLDGAPPQSTQVSRDKAYTAVGFGAPSESWSERGRGFGPDGVAMAAAAIDRLIPLAGGVPIVIDGSVVGAIGVSGGTAEEDRSVATAAVSSVFGEAAPVPAAVAGYFRALRDNDPEAWAACFAEDAIAHDPVGTPPLSGRDALRTMLEGLLPNWQRFDGIIEDEVFAAGNAVTVRWTGHGTSSHGSPVSWSGINLFLLDDTGRIATLYAVFDGESVAAQLAR